MIRVQPIWGSRRQLRTSKASDSCTTKWPKNLRRIVQLRQAGQLQLSGPWGWGKGKHGWFPVFVSLPLSIQIIRQATNWLSLSRSLHFLPISCLSHSLYAYFSFFSLSPCQACLTLSLSLSLWGLSFKANSTDQPVLYSNMTKFCSMFEDLNGSLSICPRCYRL